LERLRRIAEGDRGDSGRLLIDLDNDALVVGLEMMSVCHRFPELSEVVTPAVTGSLAWEVCDSATRSRIAFLVSLVIGAHLRRGIDADDMTKWDAILGLVSDAVRHRDTVPDGQWRPRLGQAVRASTGDALRDALVNATCSVIGEVGFSLATNSRISRRAGLTPGAVYTSYVSKDELLVDSIRVLLDDAIHDNEPLTTTAGNRHMMGEASAHLLSRGAGEARRPWTRFRLEAYIAALHRQNIADVLGEIHSLGLGRYETMLAATGLPTSIIHLVALVGQSIPLGLAVVDRYVDGLELIDHRIVTIPLLDSVAAFARP